MREERAAVLIPLYSTSLQGPKVEYEERAAVLTPLYSTNLQGSEEVGSKPESRVVEDTTEPQNLPTSEDEPGSLAVHLLLHRRHLEQHWVGPDQLVLDALWPGQVAHAVVEAAAGLLDLGRCGARSCVRIGIY